MATDIQKRLKQLSTRRRGTDRLNRLGLDAQIELARKSTVQEGWQKREPANPYTQYALGAMQEVGPEYTAKSIETAERVGKQLKERLEAKGRVMEFRLQGSVPLNVHIRGVSDVDLLNLERYFLTYAPAGARARGGLYGDPTSETSLQRLQRLRNECETILLAAYPAAEVDTTGGKAIALSGGSLARPVDVVPAHWFDTTDYQNSMAERDRAVTILDKKVPETIDNYPFLHIGRVHDRDQLVDGGLKKAIRLCKNVKNDAIEDGRAVALPSFDIAGLMYHADQNVLKTSWMYELAPLAEAQRFLEYLVKNPESAKALDVPDGSRKILNTPAKIAGLKALSAEIDDLAREVGKEQNALLRFYDASPLEESRKAFIQKMVPKV